jgi:exosortase/archaeosortase family protein
VPKVMPKLPRHFPVISTHQVLALKIVVILLATLTVFFQDLKVVFTDALSNGTTSYMLAVPFILAYLVYRKRKMLRAVMPLNNREQPRNTRHTASTAGTLLVATAALLYWYGLCTFTSLAYHMFALPLFTAGLCLVLFNPQTLRQLAFPTTVLFFLNPPPSEILSAAGSTLQTLSAEATNTIIKTISITSTLTTENGNPLITVTRINGSTIPYSIGIANSGIYALIGFAIFAILTAYTGRDKLWKKTALTAIGIPMFYLLNILGITAALLISFNSSGDQAVQTFQLLGNWIIILIGTLLLLAVSEKALKTHIFTKPTEKCLQCNPKPQPNRDYCQACGRITRPTTAKLHKIDIVKLGAIILIAALLITIQVPVFAMTQEPALITITTPSGQQSSTQILPQTANYTLKFIYRDTSFEASAQQDMALIYQYTPLNETNMPIWTSLEIATSQSSLNPWETTLTQSQDTQHRVRQIDLRDIQLTQNPPITSRYFVFNYTATNQTQAVLYWIETTPFLVNSALQTKHVEISLIAYPQNMSMLPAVETQLVALATTIANHWHPIETWSNATLFISQNNTALLIATTTGITLTIIYTVIQTRKRKKTSLTATQKLTDSSKEIIKAIQKSKKPTTLKNIAETLQKNTKEKITAEQLEQRLQALQNADLINSTIHNQNDEPTQTWKT